jgi:hypothetical protein
LFTALPFESTKVTVTLKGVPAVWLPIVDTSNRLGTPAVPVAVMVTGEPLRDPLVAVSVLAPAVVLSVQAGLVAMPALSVVTTPLEPKVPEPVATAKVTDAPLTALPCASVTFTDGAVATAVPTVALWLFPPFTAIVVAAPELTVTLPEFAAVNVGAEVNCNT